MSDQDIRYKTSDILSLYGLSNKGLFYYEERGLINPERSNGGKYRIYSLQETARIHECRLLRGYGFSVEDSITLVAHATPDELIESYTQRQREIEHDIRWSQMIIEQLKYDAEIIDAIRKGNIPFESIESPPMLRISLRNVGSTYTQQSEESYLKWQSFLPVANASLLYFDISGTNDVLPVNLGFIMNADVPQKLGIDMPLDSTLLPSKKSIHTIISGPSDVLNHRSRIQKVLDTVDKRGFTINGTPFTRMIVSMDLKDGMRRYDHLYIPIL